MGMSNSEELRTTHNSFARQSVFEFDGLRDGPLDHGLIPENTDWIATVRPIIEARISKYQAGEIHFNLMAVIQDKMDNYRKQMQQCLDNGNENGASEFRMKIMEEEELRKKWHRENVRRRHNYLPFIVELLKHLASNEQLIPVYEKAKQKSFELDKKKKAKQAAAGK